MPDHRERGFSSLEQMAQAQALVDACAEFKGAGDALAGRAARMAPISAILIDDAGVTLPESSARDLDAGVGGRLGMALLRASSAHAKPPSKMVPPPAPAARPDESDDFEAPAAPQGRWEARPPGKPKPLIDEGEDEDSLGFLVKKLEDGGFGGTCAAQVAANRAKAAARGRRP